MKRGVIPFGLVAAVLVACSGAAPTDLFIPDEDIGAVDAASDHVTGADGNGDPGTDSGPIGSQDGSGPITPDGSTGMPDAGSVCAAQVPQDGGICNSVAIQGPSLVTTCHSGVAPTPQGGMVRDGTYVLDSLDYYGDVTACPAEPEQIVWEICGGFWSTVQTSATSATGVVTFNANASTKVASVALDVTCPSTQVVNEGYDATANSLTLYVSFGANEIRLDKFKRQ